MRALSHSHDHKEASNMMMRNDGKRRETSLPQRLLTKQYSKYDSSFVLCLPVEVDGEESQC